MTDDPLCTEYTTTRSAVSSRFDRSYECGRPAKFRVLSTGSYPAPARLMCGIHARFARLDGHITEPLL